MSVLTEIKLNRRRLLAVGTTTVAGVALSALLGACGDAEDSGSGGAGSTATPEASPTPVFSAEGEAAVIQIEHDGGLLMPEDIVRRTPLVSLFNNKQMIYPGPIPEIYPQPAAPNLLVTELSSKGMDAIGRKVLETGLFQDGDQSFDSMTVSDAPSSVFTVRLAGQEPVQVSVYALEFDENESDLPEEEVAARKALRELMDYIVSAPTTFPVDHIAVAETAYVPKRLEIITFPWDEISYAFEIEPEPTDWPLDAAPSTIGEPYALPGRDARCAVLEGAELTTMLEALSGANILTPWEHLQETAYLINRPLLPGEPACVSPFEPGDDPQSGDGIEHPTDEDDVVLRYELTGGFVPIEYLVTSMPLASLYGDGRMFTEGPQIAVFPPPALPSLNVEQLTPEGIQLVLEEAEAAGLLEGKQEWDELTNYVADAGTGFLTIRANSQTHVVSVYAPGMRDIGDQVSDEEIAFRAKFDAFTGKLNALSNWLPAEVFLDVEDEYPADRLQIVSQPGDVNPIPDVEADEIDWPLATPLSEMGEPYSMLEMARCFVLEDQEFADVMSLLSDATTLTRWSSDGQQFILHIRPLLPDEAGCEDPLS